MMNAHRTVTCGYVNCRKFWYQQDIVFFVIVGFGESGFGSKLSEWSKCSRQRKEFNE